MGKEISLALAEDAWEELQEEESDAVIALLEEFRHKQPCLVGYIHALEEELFTGESQGELFLFAFWAWNCFRRLRCAMSEISEEMIEAAMAKNFDEMKQMALKPSQGLMDQAKKTIFDHCPQPEFMAVLARRIVGLHEGEKKIDDFVGLQMMHMKVIVELLDHVAQT